MRTPEEQAEWEQRYYGCRIADFRTSLTRTVTYIEGQRPLGPMATSPALHDAVAWRGSPPPPKLKPVNRNFSTESQPSV